MKKPVTFESVSVALGYPLDLAETKVLGKTDAQEALRIYQALGQKRSLNGVREFLRQQGRWAPHINTLKKWSTNEGWGKIIRDHEKRVAKELNEQLAEKQAAEEVEEIIASAIDMRHTAGALLNRIKTAISSLDLSSGQSIKAASEAVVALNRAAEQLDGGAGGGHRGNAGTEEEDEEDTIGRRKHEAVSIIDEVLGGVEEMADGAESESGAGGIHGDTDQGGGEGQRDSNPGEEGTGPE